MKTILKSPAGRGIDNIAAITIDAFAPFNTFMLLTKMHKKKCPTMLKFVEGKPSSC